MVFRAVGCVVRRDAKRDANEPDIIKALKAHGVAVTQLSQKGVPDLLCSLNGLWFVVEVKSESGKLTEDQADFLAKHDAWVHIARSAEDVEIIVRSLQCLRQTRSRANAGT